MTERERVVRLAVAVQKHPLTSSMTVYACISLTGLALRLSGGDTVGWAWATFAIAVSTSFAAIGTRMTSAWGRIAVVGVGVGAALPVAWFVFPRPDLWFLGISAALVAVPHGTVVCLDRVTMRAPRATLAVAVAAAPSLLWLIMARNVSKSGSDMALFTAWAVCLQVAIHAAVVWAPRLHVIVGGACVTALTEALVLSVRHPDRLKEHLVAQGITWLCVAPLVAFAAQARSMTAVPDDHPICADFGGARA